MAVYRSNINIGGWQSQGERSNARILLVITPLVILCIF